MRTSEALRLAILDAYRNLGELRLLVSDVLGERIQNIARTGEPLPTVVADILDWSESKGRLVELVLAAHERNRGNGALAQATAALRSSGLPQDGGVLSKASWSQLARAHDGAPNASQLEKLFLLDTPFEDVWLFVRKLTAAIRAVCRVEPQPPSESRNGYGTGFLVQPDVVMTNYHVVEPFLQSGAERVRFRFDYATNASGAGVSDGLTVGLASKDWAIVTSPVRALDFALVRLERAVGGSERESIALRPRALGVGEPLIVLQHPAARPAQLSIGSVTAPSLQNLRVGYTANTEPGSSGAPCLSSALDAVALHHRGATAANHGVHLDGILAHLRSEEVARRLSAAGLSGLAA